MRPMMSSLALALAACSGGGEPPALSPDDTATIAVQDETPVVTATHVCHSDALALDVGTGPVAFEALATGAPVTVVHGPQGGWHVDIAGQVTGTTDLVEVSSVITLASTGEAIAGEQQPNRIALVGWDDDGCAGTFFGITTYVDDLPTIDQARICAMEGETLTIELTITDLTAPSKTLTEQIDVTMALDPDDVPHCAAL